MSTDNKNGKHNMETKNEMSRDRRFQILCVTMFQDDFSKIKEMNIHSNVVFANQSDKTSYQEEHFENYTAKMITTATRGVGKNRNIALCYADAEICLLADDDITYYDGLEETVLSEFDNHPDADIFIFHFDTDSEERKLGSYKKTKRIPLIARHPWGAVRIAFRLDSIKKANMWFSTLFGGGAKYASGEDSMWIESAYRLGLKIYASKYTIGKVSMQNSTWFTGFDKKYYFSKGAFYRAVYPNSLLLWILYFSLRTGSFSELPWKERISWMTKGSNAYKCLKDFDDISRRLVE